MVDLVKREIPLPPRSELSYVTDPDAQSVVHHPDPRRRESVESATTEDSAGAEDYASEASVYADPAEGGQW